MKLKGSMRYKVGEYTSPWIDNLIPNGSTSTGVGIIFEHLQGNTTNPLEITLGKIGTGTTAPTNSDTDLETAVTSVAPTLFTKTSSSLLTISFFFSDASLADGTYTEFGLFAGSNLFSRLLISPSLVKASGQNVTIDYRIEITNV